MQQFTWISRLLWGVKEISQVACLRILVIFSKIHVVFSKLKKKTREREQASGCQGLGIVED